jgi:hypothetical protein
MAKAIKKVAKKAAPKKPAPKKVVVKEGKGRPKAIESPEMMWDMFNRYKKDIKSNPFIVKDWVGGMGKMVYREKEKPLSLEGFNVWCFEQGIISWIHDYFMNKEGRYKEFANICSIIREQIRQDQIGGGMAGIYNASITQRLNGLTEKIQEDGNKEVTIKVKYEKKETPKD